MSKQSMNSMLNDVNLSRKSSVEYSRMNKKDLWKSMISFISNFDQLRYKFVNMGLENEYLKRRIEMLENRLLEVEHLRNRKRNYRHYSRKDYKIRFEKDDS